MRKIIFVVLTCITVKATAYAQKNIPQSVLTAFHQQFPGAVSVTWDKENKTEYEAGFSWNGKRYAANYTRNGDWLETESSITFTDLPAAVQTSFVASYQIAAIKAVAKIETSTGKISYEIEVKQGRKVTELFFDEKGTRIKS